jgi:hypothetical protein
MPEPVDIFHVVVRALVYSETEGRGSNKKERPVNLEHWAHTHERELDIEVDAHSPEEAVARVTRAISLLANNGGP